MVTSTADTIASQPPDHRWVLLAYDIPRHPSARRVQIWRKLKRLGAELVHGAVWVLPATPRSREDFRWLAAEVVEAGGHASTWLASATLAQQESALRDTFMERTRASYREVLDALQAQSMSVTALIQRFRQAKQRDYFGEPLGETVGEALRVARGRYQSCGG